MNVDAFTDALTAAVRTRYGSTASVVPVSSPEVAGFFGQLMTSALQSPSFTEAIRDGRLRVWAMMVDGRAYGVGLYEREDGTVSQVQTVFGHLNRTDQDAPALQDIFVEVMHSFGYPNR